MQTYSQRSVLARLGMSRGMLQRLIGAGFVRPERGPRGEYRFSFQDMVLLRTAHGLRAAGITPRRILQALTRLRQSMPADLPLSGLRIHALGNEVAVSDAGTPRAIESGQLLFDFSVTPAARAPVQALRPSRRINAVEVAADETAQAQFRRAIDLERTDRKAALLAYRDAIRSRPDWVDPYLNLGVLLCLMGHRTEAIGLYRAGIALLPNESLLHFNLAVACEEMRDQAAALAAYNQCLRLAPAFADAHFNLARLHEEMGEANLAIRHYGAYRRLKR